MTLGTLKFRGSLLILRVTCPAAETAGCTGTLTVRTARAIGERRKRRLTIGRGRFQIPAGRTAAVRLRVSRRNVRAIRRYRRLPLAASALTRDAAGNVGRTVRSYTLRRR